LSASRKPSVGCCGRPRRGFPKQPCIVVPEERYREWDGEHAAGALSELANNMVPVRRHDPLRMRSTDNQVYMKKIGEEDP